MNVPVASHNIDDIGERHIYPKHASVQPIAAGSGIGRIAPMLDPAAERQTMLAWENFVTGNALAVMPVSKLVLSSWQRSARAGVQPASRLAPLAVRGDGLEQLRHRSDDLMWAAKGLFVNSAHLLERSGSIMMLTDQDGVVLEVAGDMGTRESAQDIHLVEGGHWHESVVGTNGIGTALAMRRPVQVHAAEHFCEGIKSWTCAAAPVFFPGTEQILGVVDISGPPSTYQGSNLVLAVAAARQIEAVLAERASREHIYLLEACLKLGARGDAVAMIVLDRNAKLIHFSGSLPGFHLHLGGGLPGLEPGRTVEEWARRLPDGLRPDWLHPVSVDGRNIGALLAVPKTLRGLAVVTHQYPRLADRPESNSEIDPLRNGFGNLVGNSPALRTAINRAEQLSGRRVSVLIHGETGVGKELFARAIHGDEARSGPFITFNCGATTKELIGSELFGHVRGAYTGATNEGRAGRFELAHGGTLCLDEIGDLPLELQPVLLRALEEGVVCRLGEAKPRRVDVRLLAMTNRDLLKEVETGRFRRDLYHRIGVTNIRVPPLRERASDVELLAQYFNHRLAERHGLAARKFGPDVMAILRAYSWPGNVREMRNVVESLLLTSNEEFVQREELPEELLAAADTSTGASAAIAATSLEEAERLAIVCAVRSMHGNLTQAARALGVSRSTLYRKVERYHLESLAQFGDNLDQADNSRH
ncbi:sigma-54-dependent Fis family transcriptional regulator [Polaromonas sp.]|uniref:sigma-54-dependent Fis family transcriptional regulator n=1 Tax=Polaromonas sp. TaxID=1869339 RepID=UPI002D1FBAD2|nr:sigma-54-dependent Fis family transcriptional regulator [Polaromonas sp.]